LRRRQPTFRRSSDHPAALRRRCIIPQRRDAPKRFGLQVILIHMAAIGLGVALVVVLNNPFRGQSKIGPAIICGALKP
jgi:hypothetical protein